MGICGAIWDRVSKLWVCGAPGNLLQRTKQLFDYLLALVAILWVLWCIPEIASQFLHRERPVGVFHLLQGLALILLLESCLMLARIIWKVDLVQIIDTVIISIAALLVLGSQKQVELLLSCEHRKQFARLAAPGGIALLSHIVIGVLLVCLLCLLRLRVKPQEKDPAPRSDPDAERGLTGPKEEVEQALRRR